MKYFSKFIIVVCATVISALSLNAQNSVNSPYSAFGYGILSDNVTSAQRGMGGVGYAMNSGRQINVMNPASYAAIDTLTFLFDIGCNLRSTWSQEGSVKGTDLGGGLDYVTMQFPLGRYMGASVGLLPFSQVGYSFNETLTDLGTVSRQGSGGINQVYAGVAARPFKGFTLGANVAYLFGTSLNDTYVTTSASNESLFERVLKVSDYRLDLGVQYTLSLPGENSLTAGATFSPEKPLRGHTYGVRYAVQSSSSAAIVPDTTGYTSLKGFYSLPYTIGAGLNWRHGDRFMAEADFTYQPWSRAKYQAIEGYELPQQFSNRWKGAVGVQITPRSRGRYYERIQYRAGAFVSRDYLMVAGNNVNEYGASIGLGLPTANSMMLRSIVNISLEYRHRQASPSRLISENSLLLTLGVNFNEMWFFQSRIH